MQKINFQNLPNTTTPINATNLNAIQTNVEDVFNGNVAMGDIKAGNIKFIPASMGNLNLNDVGTTSGNGYSQELALHNTGNITNAPYTDEVAILKTYSWGGNSDWVVQEWFGLTNNRKYIREKHPDGWLNWKRIYNEKILYEGNANTDINIGENILNYEYIEIFYQDEVGRITGSLKTKPITGSTSTGEGLLCLSLTETENAFIVFKTATWYIDSTWLRKTNEAFTQVFHNGTIAGNNNTGWLWIKKVVGYN